MEANSNGGVISGIGGGGFIVRSYGNSYFNGGNVGIGVTEPGSKLEVNGDIKISDYNNGLIIMSENGTEWKITVDNNGNLTTNIITSNKLIEVDRDVKIFPNPANEQINIEISGLNGSVDIEIYNLSGKMIFMKNYKSNLFSINISDFESGNYILKVKDENGYIIGTKKFIKM